MCCSKLRLKDRIKKQQELKALKRKTDDAQDDTKRIIDTNKMLDQFKEEYDNNIGDVMKAKMFMEQYHNYKAPRNLEERILGQPRYLEKKESEQRVKLLGDYAKGLLSKDEVQNKIKEFMQSIGLVPKEEDKKVEDVKKDLTSFDQRYQQLVSEGYTGDNLLEKMGEFSNDLMKKYQQYENIKGFEKKLKDKANKQTFEKLKDYVQTIKQEREEGVQKLKDIQKQLKDQNNQYQKQRLFDQWKQQYQEIKEKEKQEAEKLQKLKQEETDKEVKQTLDNILSRIEKEEEEEFYEAQTEEEKKGEEQTEEQKKEEERIKKLEEKDINAFERSVDDYIQNLSKQYGSDINIDEVKEKYEKEIKEKHPESIQEKLKEQLNKQIQELQQQQEEKKKMTDDIEKLKQKFKQVTQEVELSSIQDSKIRNYIMENYEDQDIKKNVLFQESNKLFGDYQAEKRQKEREQEESKTDPKKEESKSEEEEEEEEEYELKTETETQAEENLDKDLTKEVIESQKKLMELEMNRKQSEGQYLYIKPDVGLAFINKMKNEKYVLSDTEKQFIEHVQKQIKPVKFDKLSKDEDVYKLNQKLQKIPNMNLEQKESVKTGNKLRHFYQINVGKNVKPQNIESLKTQTNHLMMQIQNQNITQSSKNRKIEEIKNINYNAYLQYLIQNQQTTQSYKEHFGYEQTPQGRPKKK